MRHFKGDIISLYYFMSISFFFTTISPKRRKALKANRKIDLNSNFVYKFCIEVFIPLIMFAKMGPVTGNLESLQGAEW